MMRIGVAFSGPSNSGKTTLITKVAAKFIDDGLKVVVVKHDPKDKAVFDDDSKDSAKFSALGADTVVISPTRTTYFSKKPKELDEVIKMVEEFDIFIVEGLKTLPLPRISVFSQIYDKSYESCSDAIATDGFSAPSDLRCFDRDDVKSICEWIVKNGKKL